MLPVMLMRFEAPDLNGPALPCGRPASVAFRPSQPLSCTIERLEAYLSRGDIGNPNCVTHWLPLYLYGIAGLSDPASEKSIIAAVSCCSAWVACAQGSRGSDDFYTTPVDSTIPIPPPSRVKAVSVRCVICDDATDQTPYSKNIYKPDFIQ